LSQRPLEDPGVVLDVKASGMGQRQQGVPAPDRRTTAVAVDSGIGQEVGEDHCLAPADLVQGTELIRLLPAIPLTGDRVANEVKTAHRDLGSIGTAGGRPNGANYGGAQGVVIQLSCGGR
jgi:hypothetical protein